MSGERRQACRELESALADMTVRLHQMDAIVEDLVKGTDNPEIEVVCKALMLLSQDVRALTILAEQQTRLNAILLERFE